MKHLIIGTAGHVDHGKTALIKALTRVDLDSHKEEKERGITINLGFTHIDLPNGNSIGVIDVPGHKDFVDTMVSGACGIDMVMMVIAADSGIMPQTIEHLNIINSLGIKTGIVVITRIDLVDNDFVDLVKLEIMESFEGSVLENAAIVPVSSITGQGIDVLVKEIENISKEVKSKSNKGNFRMFIDRLFNIKGFGIVVTGSVLNGKVNVGDDVFLAPSKVKALKVRSIERHGQRVDFVEAGDRAAINIVGLKPTDFTKGMVLSGIEKEGVQIIDAIISLFDDKSKLKLWSNIIFHFGTYTSQARIHLLDKEKISGGESALVQIHLEKPVVLINKDKFIMRSTSGDKTIGSGVVLDIAPLHHRKRSTKLLSYLEELVEATLSDDSLYLLIKIELKKLKRPVYLSEIAESLNKSDNQILDTCINSDKQDIAVYKNNGNPLLVDDELDKENFENIISQLTDWHKKYPILMEGLDTNVLLGKIGAKKIKSDQDYINCLVKRMEAEGQIKLVNSKWILAKHKVLIDEKTKKDLDWLNETIRAYELQKPVNSDIEKEAVNIGINKERLNMLLKYLANNKDIYFIDNDYIHAEIVNVCRKQVLMHMLEINRGLNEGDFRKAINATKKIVHPLIKLFIKEGIIKQEVNIVYITQKGKDIINKL